MKHIAIISSSIREKRNSHRVALYFKKFITENKLATVEILDLKEYQFPLFTDTLRLQPNALPQATEFAEKIKAASGVLIIAPEYNGGYPASLKNAIDLLYDEWHHKPIGICSVSTSPFGGMQMITSLQFVLWKIKAWIVPAMFPVALVNKTFDEKGNASNAEEIDKLAKVFINELQWYMEANKRMIADEYVKNEIPIPSV